MDTNKYISLKELCDQKEFMLFHLCGDKQPVDNYRKDALHILFCSAGYAQIQMNGEILWIEKGQLLIGFPGDIISEITYSHAFTGYYLSFSLSLISNLFVLSSSSWNSCLYIREKQILQPQKENMNLLISYLSLFHERFKHPELEKQNIKNFYSLIDCFITDFFEIIGNMQLADEPNQSTAVNLLFSKFVRLLSVSGFKKQTVKFYADQLCVTPKYLSSVCKKTSGKSATTLINQFLIKEICYQLKKQNKSIQEIAYELGFPNQSFFGKYIKKHLSLTASQLRKKTVPAP